MDAPPGTATGELLTEEQWRERRRQRWMEHRRRRVPLFGIILVVWGFAWLGNELGWWDLGGKLVAPVAVILLGVASLARWGSRGW